PVKVNGTVVSSTAIRAAIEAGDLARAAEMLGREYTILGTVKEGARLGRQLGFPTANLGAHSEQFPPNGVYFVEAWLHGVLHHGLDNIGFRPTLPGDKPEHGQRWQSRCAHERLAHEPPFAGAEIGDHN